MQRREEHVAAVVEDVLRAVTVVIIDVEHRDAAGTAVAQRLGRDRRIVEKAVSAVVGAARVVPGRPAEGEGAILPVGHQTGAGQRNVRRSGDRTPRAGRDRGAGVEGIIAELAVDMVGQLAAHSRREPIERQRVMIAMLGRPRAPGCA